MRAPTALLLAACLAACAQPPPPAPAPVAAAPAPQPPPAPTERLDVPLHDDGITWQSAGSGTLPGGGEAQEYVPAGETIADWSQMVTTLTLPAGQDPAARLTQILNHLRAACRSYRVIQSTSQDSPYPSKSLLVRCDKPDEAVFADPNILLRRHEALWAKTVQGPTQGYLVLRAWHGDAIPSDSVLLSRAVRREWQDWLDQVTPVNGAS
ncbi:MAG TPA: hypothetical protein VMB71_02320 [Acetobacteraceae bacterium]|nr:hypothetical protein [Acetobacteraceae bacterium]